MKVHSDNGNGEDKSFEASWTWQLETLEKAHWRYNGESKEGAELRGCIGKTVSPPVVY